MAKKFDFLSPGVEIREIDQSFLPQEREAEGPIIIGRTRKGPANKPVRVRNLDDFVSVFGLPIAGGSTVQGDMWRDGNMAGPTYASYAAQAWLASEQSPVTIVRLAGDEKSGASSFGKAGWALSASINSAALSNSTAYGLFLIQSASAVTMTTGSLAAVFYANKGYLTLDGTQASDGVTNTKKAGTFIKSVATNCEFKLAIYNEAGEQVGNSLPFNFSRNSPNYLRSVFNTNPQLVNETTEATVVNGGQRKTYWLGESFTRELDDLSLLGLSAGAVYGILLPLEAGSVNWSDHREGAQEAQSGFLISQKSKGQVDLFRFKSLHVGEEIQKNYIIAIENINEPTNATVDAYGTFTVCVKTTSGQTIERYSGCNLNPSSPNYIGKRIGDQYQEWSDQDRRYRTYGDYQNQSDIIYVDIKDFVKNGGAQGHLPVGFKGPVRPKGFTLAHGSTGAQTLGDVVDTRTAASAVIQATNGAADTDTILITAADGTSATFTAKTSPGANPEFNRGGADHGLANLKAAIEANATIGSKVTVSAVTEPSSGTFQMTITQVTAGTVGNGKAVTIGTGDFTAYTVNGGSAGASGTFTGGVDTTDDFTGAFVKGNASVPGAAGSSTNFVIGPTNFSASFLFPALPLRANGTEGGAADPYRAYYGIRPSIGSTTTTHDPDYCDYLRRLPATIDSFTPATDYEHSFIFTLDDLVINSSNNTVTYTSGSWSQTADTSTTSWTSPANTQANQNGDIGSLLDLGVRQFSLPLHGGFEGWDITEREPLRDDLINLHSSRNDSANYLHYTINKALDSIRDPEVVPGNLLAIPGIRRPLITNRVISIAEDRKDVLAIIDLEHDYLPLAERDTADTNASTLGDVGQAVSTLRSRNLNSSYACTFYPWVQASDNLNGSELVWLPPSVAALGAFGKSQARSELWFAPAGFNRGGLGSLGGSRGPAVLQARQRLDSKERDQLYEQNINPIATFPAEGVVIFGQKTLQADASALDRINVRRLLLFLKSRVNEVSRNLLFDNNVQSTWNRFKGQVEPLLADTQARFGLSGYKLVLDETTTTADLIDRNIMYAKIFVKPARAIEYIVVDFVITRTGADFV